MARPNNAKSVHLAGMMLLTGVLALFASPVAGAKEGATFCTRQYDPVCAEVWIQPHCVRAPCPPMKWRRTYANACFARAAGGRILYQGVCGKPARSDPDGCGKPGRHVNPGDDPNCKSWTDGCNICRRARPGGPATCTKMACERKGSPRCLLRFGERHP